MRNDSNNGDQAPPVKEGEELDIFINAVGEKGDGIARKNGFVIFVPKTKKGQYVKIKISKVLKNVAFGEFIEVLEKPEPKGMLKISKDELQNETYEPQPHAEDSEDFGEDLDDTI